MKKVLFALMFTLALLFSTNLGAQAHEIQSKEMETESYVPISRLWYETLPTTYKGRYIYHRTERHFQCLDGYLGARNIGAGHYIYEGYLYPCGGPKPIPTLKPVEEKSE